MGSSLITAFNNNNPSYLIVLTPKSFCLYCCISQSNGAPIWTLLCQVQRNLTLVFLSWSTYPDPLPPTMATFFPAGTSKETPLSTFCPSKYSKYTSSNLMVASWGATSSGGAISFSFGHKGYKKTLLAVILAVIFTFWGMRNGFSQTCFEDNPLQWHCQNNGSRAALLH